MVDPDKALGYQQALSTFARIVSEAADTQRLLQNAAAQVARITHIKHVKVLRYRPDQGDLLIEAGVGWHPAWSAMSASAPTGIPRRAARCRPVRRSRAWTSENDPEFRYADVLREHGIISVCNVPILVDGKHWGVLEVDTEEKTRLRISTSIRSRSSPTSSASPLRTALRRPTRCRRRATRRSAGRRAKC